MKLPAGPGVRRPPDAADDLLAEATAACRGVRTLTAEVAVSGSVGGHRLRGRLLAGVAAPASARLEAVAPFGRPVFIFVAPTGRRHAAAAARRARARARPAGGGARCRGRRAARRRRPADTADRLCARRLHAARGGRRSATTGACVRRRRPADGVSASRGARRPWRLVAVVRRERRARVARGVSRSSERPAARSDLQSRRASGQPGRTRVRSAAHAVAGRDERAARCRRRSACRSRRGAEPITLEELRQSGPLAPQADGR